MSQEIYYVGGWVRDLAMGIKSKDIDLLFIGEYDEMYRHVSSVCRDIYKVDEKQKVIRAHHYELGPLDFNSAKCLKTNLMARDFTMNSMAIPVGGTIKDIIDLSSGLEDIKLGKIVPNANSLKEDPARIFRALRFCIQYGYKLSLNESEVKIIKNMLRGVGSGIDILKERSQQEFNKAVSSIGPSNWYSVIKTWESEFEFDMIQLMVDAGMSFSVRKK